MESRLPSSKTTKAYDLEKDLVISLDESDDSEKSDYLFYIKTVGLSIQFIVDFVLFIIEYLCFYLLLEYYFLFYIK